MNQKDSSGPFDDNDRTVIRPMPGGRSVGDSAIRPTPVERRSSESLLKPMPGGRRSTDGPLPGEQAGFNFSSPTLSPSTPVFSPAPVAELPTAEFQENPMVAAALALMSLASRLRQTPVFPGVDELRKRMQAEISGFENRLLQSGVTTEHTRMASYALCSFLDETILNTPWGAQSTWGHQSLLISFHKEAWGGEKFFDIVTTLAKQPAQNLALIELCYLFLSLGFEGKFRVVSNAGNALEKYRTELYQLIRRVRGDRERELSPRWQGLKDVRNTLVRYVPLWVVSAILSVALLVAYLGFMLALNARSDQVYKQLFDLAKMPIEISRTTLPARVVKPVEVERRERFKQLLSNEIAAGMVEVVDDRLIRIRNSFASGSDQLKPGFVSMLKKIADELATGKDNLVVIGYTDDQPIVSAQFPSNWHLSTSRAKKVSEMLNSQASLSGKTRFEGRAEGEPLVPNDSSEHRAINRRVDLLIQ
jgi:type VI secretion system protein ImpK